MSLRTAAQTKTPRPRGTRHKASEDNLSGSIIGIQHLHLRTHLLDLLGS